MVLATGLQTIWERGIEQKQLPGLSTRLMRVLTSMMYVAQPKELGMLSLEKRCREYVIFHMEEGLALLWVAWEGQ